MFDHEGSGKENKTAQELQNDLNSKFALSSWGNERARAIVFSPELEAWVWSKSPHVDEVAGWKNSQPSLRAWLVDQGWLKKGDNKPKQPKEAFEAALRKAQIPRSSSLYRQIAERVSLDRCTDQVFREFRQILKTWFKEI